MTDGLSASIKGIRRDDGEIVIGLFSSGKGHLTARMTPEEARRWGELLIVLADAQDMRTSASLSAEIRELRRAQQQLTTALQEVARKVARLDAQAGTTSVQLVGTPESDDAFIDEILSHGWVSSDRIPSHRPATSGDILALMGTGE